jgi:hypothetical protein
LPLYLWLQTLYFARIFYVVITKHLQSHQKNVANPYCYLTTCYASQPTSYSCINCLLHLLCSYYNDSMLKQKGKNLVVHNTCCGLRSNSVQKFHQGLSCICTNLIDLYKYSVTTSINCKDMCFCIARDIRYQKVISFIIGEYVSLKLTLGLYVKPCVTSLALYLTTSSFLFFFE